MDKRLLVVVAHPDDECLMAGGTIAKWASAGREVRVLIIADGVSSRTERLDMREFNARLLMCSRASDVLGCNGEVLGWPDNQLDTLPLLKIVKEIEKRIEDFQPCTVITHWHGDMNIDHRLVSDAVKVACRPQPGCSVKTLLMGEVPSSTDWAGGFNPTWYEDVTAHWEKKMDAVSCYAQEIPNTPHARSATGIYSMASRRGSIVGDYLAEAFEVVRHIQ